MCGVATRERCGAAVIACTRLFIEFFPERTLVTVMGPAHSATGAGPQRVSGAAYTVTSQSADAGRTRDTATFSRAAVNSARRAVIWTERERTLPMTHGENSAGQSAAGIPRSAETVAVLGAGGTMGEIGRAACR